MTLKNIKQTGFSLIELMIAMVIGLLIIGAVTQMLTNNYKNYRLQSSVAESQENMRFAVKVMRDAFLNAGYTGCTDLFQRSATPTSGILPVAGVYTANNVLSGQVGGAAVGFVNTDVVTVMTTNSCNAVLSADTTLATGGVIPLLNDSCNINKATNVLITDCDSGQVFQPTGAGTALTVNTWSGTAELFNLGVSEAFQIERRQYFLAQSAGVAVRELRERRGGTTNTLVEGVDDLQFRYGLDINFDGIVDGTYQAIGSMGASDWQNVISVKIYMLTVSTLANVIEGAVPAAAVTFPMEGGVTLTASAADRRFRRPFMTTVTIRNRVN